MNNRGVSPLVATILLVVFSLVLGTVTMNIGQAYIEGLDAPQEQQEAPETTYINGIAYVCMESDSITGECLSWEKA